MSREEPEVPPEIEDYLVGLSAHAGEIRGSAGARGGAWGAARLKTKVEQRSDDAPGTAEQVTARLTAAFPKAKPLPVGDHLRLAVPVGVTGLQQIIDAELGPGDGTRVPVRLRGFGKEGLISRKRTRRVADQAWAAIMSAAD